MDQGKWRDHIEHRTDFATRVTHLTRRTAERTAFENLVKILKEKRIVGSTTASGYIVGSTPAVCFQDVPLLSLAENIVYELENKEEEKTPRYEAYGLRFNKAQLFIKGARPVIYGPKQELKLILPKEEYWRIVNLDIQTPDYIIDWTHEREWRIPGNLEFEYNEIEIIVYSEEDYRKLVELLIEYDSAILKQINGIVCLKSILN